MPAVEIPGYYYDEAKNKYFKIEKSHTAPPSAAWSADSVKKRRVEDTARREARHRAHLVRNHVKRSVLRRNILPAGLLARETEIVRSAAGGVAGYGARADDGDLGAAAWVSGVVDKGHVPFVPSFARTRFANMPCFYVGGEDTKTGLGVAYATLDEETLVGSYISTDDNDRITFDRDRPGTLERGPSFRTEMIRCPQMSSIKYHKPSHKILLTSREPDHSCGLYFFSPPLSPPDDPRPHWLLGETNHYQRLSIRHRLRDEWLVHQSTPAPAASDLLCVIGTNAGILRVRSNETMAWIAPQSPPKGLHLPQEIFDQDFQHGNHNILLAGGRQPRLWMTDLRTPESDWSWTRHASSIAHLRSVNEHQILVAGLQNSMALYDMRFFGRRPNGISPLLDFPAYRNAAHFHTGWDVSPSLGVAAAAQDDGTVRLFSLRSGRALRRPAMDRAARTDTPVRALMFQQMPWEKTPSLFVGEGPSLRKYSFGTVDVDDEA
ncbi:hypothetical protein PLIIFM63780_008212 [Purpureocillium lilacinum]|uniref:uncharacterized protein n=1 Tax=Purpureocillium lilacinum TaxID=33203 RepID=UPI0020857D6E|nr:hypothetical protein PLICBS_008222 [Purpureocillium lilacinum]GJN84651.1 hypothetical protein PLIIFM63780_008212 [Purpureocillium lilacinum]